MSLSLEFTVISGVLVVDLPTVSNHIDSEVNKLIEADDSDGLCDALLSLRLLSRDIDCTIGEIKDKLRSLEVPSPDPEDLRSDDNDGSTCD